MSVEGLFGIRDIERGGCQFYFRVWGGVGNKVAGFLDRLAQGRGKQGWIVDVIVRGLRRCFGSDYQCIDFSQGIGVW